VLATDLIDRTRVARMLADFRGMPAVDPNRLIDALRAFRSWPVNCPACANWTSIR